LIDLLRNVYLIGIIRFTIFNNVLKYEVLVSIVLLCLSSVTSLISFQVCTWLKLLIILCLDAERKRDDGNKGKRKWKEKKREENTGLRAGKRKERRKLHYHLSLNGKGKNVRFIVFSSKLIT